jgi:hypothetical protein
MYRDQNVIQNCGNSDNHDFCGESNVAVEPGTVLVTTPGTSDRDASVMRVLTWADTWYEVDVEDEIARSQRKPR